MTVYRLDQLLRTNRLINIIIGNLFLIYTNQKKVPKFEIHDLLD